MAYDTLSREALWRFMQKRNIPEVYIQLVQDIYTTIGGLSSIFEDFLAVRSQFDCDHGVNFSAPTCCQSATFVRPLFAFYCRLFFRKGLVIMLLDRKLHNCYLRSFCHLINKTIF